VIDMGSIMAAIGGLQTASQIAKSMIDLRDAALFQGKTIELQNAILAAQTSALAAQSEQFALVQRVRDAEEKVARMEAWETEKKRYDLYDYGDSRFTYRLKQSLQGSEPMHELCANCYNSNHQKSILHMETRIPGMAEVLVCEHCGANLYVQGQWREEHAKALRKPSTRR